MVWLTSLLYLRYSRRFSPLKTFRVNGTAFPTCLILEVTSTSAKNLKRASKQHIFKTPSPWNWNVSLGPIRSPPIKTVYFLPNPPLRYLYIFSPNLWGLSRFCLFSISITLSQKNAPKRESVSVFLFITVRFLWVRYCLETKRNKILKNERLKIIKHNNRNMYMIVKY